MHPRFSSTGVFAAASRRENSNSLFSHLKERWSVLFDARHEVLLYDLTSTYFESDPDFGEDDKRKFGYSRDKRSDCVQVVIALVITPEGFPVAYEVMAGNTSDKTTLSGFLAKIEDRYGKLSRIWLMDRGIPTEDTLEQMRRSDPPACTGSAGNGQPAVLLSECGWSFL
jgi:transposase